MIPSVPRKLLKPSFLGCGGGVAGRRAAIGSQSLVYDEFVFNPGGGFVFFDTWSSLLIYPNATALHMVFLTNKK